MMIIDCMTCPVRGQRCDDCAVTVLHAGTVPSGHGLPGDSGRHDTAVPDGELLLDAAERRVVSLFVGAGLVRRGAAAELRARQEIVDTWDPVWDVG
jgi:hypothetical protein